MDITSPSMGPYGGLISKTEHVRTLPNHPPRTFILIGYRSYNALGLIGSERNGIAVLDCDNMEVLLDDHAKASSGYALSVEDVRKEISRLGALSAEGFEEFVRTHPRSRNPNFSLKPAPRRTYEDPIRRTAKLLLGPDMGYNKDLQEEFYKWGRAACRRIAKLLDLQKGTYDIRVNRGGIAVSGEVTLHHDRFYLQWSQPGYGQKAVLLRSCEGRQDYTGGVNQWVVLSDIAQNERVLLRSIKRILEPRRHVVRA